MFVDYFSFYLDYIKKLTFAGASMSEGALISPWYEKRGTNTSSKFC